MESAIHWDPNHTREMNATVCALLSLPAGSTLSLSFPPFAMEKTAEKAKLEELKNRFTVFALTDTPASLHSLSGTGGTVGLGPCWWLLHCPSYILKPETCIYHFVIGMPSCNKALPNSSSQPLNCVTGCHRCVRLSGHVRPPCISRPVSKGPNCQAGRYWIEGLRHHNS